MLPVEILAYTAVGSSFVNLMANLIEAYLIIQLRGRVLTHENSYLKISNIVSTRQTGIINGTDDIDTINNSQSKIITSNRNGVLIGNDYLITQSYSDDKYLTFNMLRSPTVEKPELLDGTRWIFTSQEMIIFLDGGQTTEQELEAGTNSIATTHMQPKQII